MSDSGPAPDPSAAGRRIVFAGTPAFAVPALRAVLESGADVTAVLTQPDRPAGRGRQPRPSEVKEFALSRGLAIRQPAALGDSAVAADLGPRPDALVVAAYGLLLPAWLLAWPRVACINVHASLLPRWRGAAPIQHAILAGDAETGISIMQMDAGLDTGPVYATRATAIAEHETAGSLHERLAALGGELLAAVLPSILAGELEAAPQDHAQARRAPKIEKADAKLDWRKPAETLERIVRAFNPWPVAEAMLSDGQRLRIWQAKARRTDGAAAPGAIVASTPAGIDVATGGGLLRIERLQRPGGRAMDVSAYLAAHGVADVRFEV